MLTVVVAKGISGDINTVDDVAWVMGGDKIVDEIIPGDGGGLFIMGTFREIRWCWRRC